jgi:hypothetical protein
MRSFGWWATAQPRMPAATRPATPAPMTDRSDRRTLVAEYEKGVADQRQREQSEREGALERLLAERPVVWEVTEELREWAKHASACEESGERDVDYEDAVQLGPIAGGREGHEWFAWWYEEWSDPGHPGGLLAVTATVAMSAGARDGIAAGAITTLPVRRADERGSCVRYQVRSWGPRVVPRSSVPLP